MHEENWTCSDPISNEASAISTKSFATSIWEYHTFELTIMRHLILGIKTGCNTHYTC